jgi:hypothetical protein
MNRPKKSHPNSQQNEKDSPGRPVLSVKLLFNVSCDILFRARKKERGIRLNVAGMHCKHRQSPLGCTARLMRVYGKVRYGSLTYLLDIVFGQRLGCNIYGILLHLFFHVRIFNYSLSLLTHDGIDYLVVMQYSNYWLKKERERDSLEQAPCLEIMIRGSTIDDRPRHGSKRRPASGTRTMGSAAGGSRRNRRVSTKKLFRKMLFFVWEYIQ